MPEMIKIKNIGFAIKGKWQVHIALFECPYCSKHFEANIADIKRKRVRHCGCSNWNEPLPLDVNGIKTLTDLGTISNRRTAIFQCPQCTAGTFKAVVSDVKRGKKSHCGCVVKSKPKFCQVKDMELLRKKTVVVLNNCIRKMKAEQNLDLNQLKNRIRSLIRTSIRKKGYSKKSATFEILGCTVEEFYTHIESLFLPEMGWYNRDKWHIDHIIPLNTANTEAELIALNHYTNLRPLWAFDNMSKGKKVPEGLCVKSLKCISKLTYESIKQEQKQKRLVSEERKSLMKKKHKKKQRVKDFNTISDNYIKKNLKKAGHSTDSITQSMIDAKRLSIIQWRIKNGVSTKTLDI